LGGAVEVNRVYTDSESHTEDRVAVWSSDAIFPVFWYPDFFDNLSAMNPIVHREDGATGVVSFVGALSDNDFVLAGWDMECSALLSSASAMGVKLAVSLVVSYTSKQASSIGRRGDAGRGAEEKVLVHRVEDDLILRAIEFLFLNVGANAP